MLWIEQFIRPYDRHESLGFGSIDDIMGIPDGNIYDSRFCSSHMIADHLISPDLPETEISFSGNDKELFYLSIMPVISPGDSGSGRRNRKLAFRTRFNSANNPLASECTVSG